jgi:hypothetical protein
MDKDGAGFFVYDNEVIGEKDKPDCSDCF